MVVSASTGNKILTLWKIVNVFTSAMIERVSVKRRLAVGVGVLQIPIAKQRGKRHPDYDPESAFH